MWQGRHRPCCKAGAATSARAASGPYQAKRRERRMDAMERVPPAAKMAAAHKKGCDHSCVRFESENLSCKRKMFSDSRRCTDNECH